VVQVYLTNTDPLATLPTVPAGVNTLVVNFSSAPIALPNLNVPNVSVTAQGIVQQPGTALNIAGIASFNSGSFPLLLTNTGNQFNFTRLPNSGPNDVALNAADGIVFGACILGSGKLTVSVNGPITQFSGSITQAAGAVGATFSAGANPITLDQSTNVFTGPV